MELPRSPRSSAPIQTRNCFHSGSFEPELLADLGDGLGRGVLAGHDGGRIARRQVQQQEHEHRDDGHDRQHGEQASDDVGAHGFSGSWSLALRF